MTLDKIKTETTWSDASATLNENFARILKGIRDGIPTTETPVDEQMSDESENAVQNKVIKKYVDDEIVHLEGYAEEVVNDLENNIKTNPSEYVKLKTINGKSLYGSGNIVIEGGAGGAGLQYAVERTVYPTKMTDFMGDEFEDEITEEQRAYNIETYTKASEDGNVFVTFNGILLSTTLIVHSPTGYASFSFVGELDGGLISITITISANGDAVSVIKPIQTGGGSATPSDMNSDFNNDF